MLRKIIQQNSTTFVVSLPKKWTLENKLRKGDNLEITQNKRELSITIPKGKLEGIFDFSELKSKRSMRILLNCIYREGYHSISIKINNKLEKFIMDLINNNRYIGWEIASSKSDVLKIETITIATEENKKILSRLILLIKNQFDFEDKFYDKIERYYQFLRRNNPEERSDFIRTLILIAHGLQRIEEKNIFTKSKLVKEIKCFFDLVYVKQFNNKKSMDTVQEIYKSIEDMFFKEKPSHLNLILWEIFRNINIGSIYIENKKLVSLL